MNLPAIVLAGFVTFTPPTTGVKCATCCAPDTMPLRSCYAAVLYVFGQQSPEWIEHLQACLTDPARWARVVLQAAPRQVSSKAICPPFTTRDSLPYPDSLANRAAFVVTRNAAGGFCWSNVVTLR